MAWLNIKLVASVFMLSAFSTAVSASTEDTQINQEVADSCRPVLTLDVTDAHNRDCTDRIKSHLNDVIISEEKSAEIETNLNAQLEKSFSAFQQRALQTRAGSYLLRDHHYAIQAACLLNGNERATHINNIVSEIGFTGQARLAFIDKINKKVERGVMC